MANENQIGKDWKKELQELHKKHSEASHNKINNKSVALKWVNEKLIPAFNELENELLEQNGIKMASHKEADSISLNNTLQFNFQETLLQYSIQLQISSKDVKGKISFIANNKKEEYEPKDVPSILNWKEKEIIEDFLKAYANWDIDIEKPPIKRAGAL